MSVLWTSEAAAAATGGQTPPGWAATGVSIDTRSLQPGDLFVALKDVRDGHDFVAQALDEGAAAALVSRVPDGVPEDAPLLIVPDVLPALEALGRAARARSAAQVIAVTGSVGKTSTKEMLRAALAPFGAVHAAEKSFNNHWGVPLTLARLPHDAAFAVIEIGMNHPGEIAPLAALARPHIAIVTTVVAAHLEAFDNVDGIAREKAAIFTGLQPGGTAIFNGDIETADILATAALQAGARALTFGAQPGRDVRLTELRLHPGMTVAQARLSGEELLFKLPATGRHFAENALAVLACVSALDQDLALALAGLGGWTPPTGRGQAETIVLDPVEPALSFTLIDDAFNANPASMRAAFEVLAAHQPRDGLGRVRQGRRVAVLGDMLELGEAEAALHAALADEPSLDGVARVHCVGPRMKHLYSVLPAEQRGDWFETAQDACARAGQLADAGDVVLVKGSKGSDVSRVVDALRKLGHMPPIEQSGEDN